MTIGGGREWKPLDSDRARGGDTPQALLEKVCNHNKFIPSLLIIILKWDMYLEVYMGVRDI